MLSWPLRRESMPAVAHAKAGLSFACVTAPQHSSSAISAGCLACLAQTLSPEPYTPSIVPMWLRVLIPMHTCLHMGSRAGPGPGPGPGHVALVVCPSTEACSHHPAACLCLMFACTLLILSPWPHFVCMLLTLPRARAHMCTSGRGMCLAARGRWRCCSITTMSWQ